jgi:hypothetical protein
MLEVEVEVHMVELQEQQALEVVQQEQMLPQYQPQPLPILEVEAAGQVRQVQ